MLGQCFHKKYVRTDLLHKQSQSIHMAMWCQSYVIPLCTHCQGMGTLSKRDRKSPEIHVVVNYLTPVRFCINLTAIY